MFEVEGYSIRLSRGDTGAMIVSATATKGGEAFIFGEDDRALFSIKNSMGEILKQRAYPITDNQFTVYFFNADTDSAAPGDYNWDVRYVIHPYYDSDGNIIDGDQVITPEQPQTMQLLTVVGEI